MTPLLTPERPTFYGQAACRKPDVDPDLFFPNERQNGRAARQVCNECPVQTDCLEYGIRTQRYGIWGGKSPKQIRKLRVARGILLPAYEE